METISVKLDPQVLKNLDRFLKEFNYSTRTDFIREAIRDKMKDFEKQQAIRKLARFKGAAKKKTSEKEYEFAREKAAIETARKLGIRLD